MALARDPFNASDDYWRRVVALRLHISEGERRGRAWRRIASLRRRAAISGAIAPSAGLREAYFVAIVTPGHQAAPQDAGRSFNSKRGVK